MSLEALKAAVVGGKRKEVSTLIPVLLDAGTEPRAILDNALIPAMAEVGEKFKRGEIFVPEMLVSARAMKAGMQIIEPRLLAAGIKPEFVAVIGTVEGDLHDIGKNLVATMWKGSGIDVIDLGTNVTPAQFVTAVQQHKAQLVGLSALLTTTMPAMKETVKHLRAAGLPVKVLIGGAPITQTYADEIGADGFAKDAASAVDAARKVLAAA
ncbi:B12-binding domain-containing protein [Nibricoccus sp. IMCC34717]|uniref:cobalamin B12-binding domain-containing protein n=1 Tax=Nibricoccus sp. IMCC34717 TaxID=3034021 RepID=UPI0038505381